MICPHCRSDSTTDDGLCSNCGKSIGAQTLDPVAATSTRVLSAPPSFATSGPLVTGQAFGSRYHIIRELGVGGMGAVYQAWDDELGVAVALKVIRPELTPRGTAGGDVERRFKRELLLARQVTHKNVVRIHD